MATELDLTPLLTLAANAHPDETAVLHSGGALTWAELEHLVQRCATGLASQGIVAGHRVMLCMSNRVEFIVAYIATLRVQAVAVPINPRSTEHEIVRMAADSGSRLVVSDAERLDVVRASVDRVRRALAGDPDPADLVIGAEVFDELLARAQPIRIVTVGATPREGELGWADLLAVTPQPHPIVQDEEKLAALLYTSGTSGRPRAAMLTHRALHANIDQVAAVEPPMMQSGDVVLAVLPLFHVYGLNAVLGGALKHAATLVLVDHFDPAGVLDLIAEHAVTVVPVAPPVFRHWLSREDLREKLASVRLVLSGSAPLAPETMTTFTEATGLTVHQGYGLTEAAPVVTSTLATLNREGGEVLVGSVGAPLPGVEIQLVDERSGQPEGEDPGEIRIRGANLFSGYWPDGADGPDPDGWWSTGDVGFLNGADNLFLVDRVRDLIIVSGFNVYPVEVEEVIGEVRGVAQVAVVGAASEATGEEVVAYLVPTPEADPDALIAAVEGHCSDRLARFKQPHRIEIVETLPRTVTGKIQKGRLRGIERRRALGLLE